MNKKALKKSAIAVLLVFVYVAVLVIAVETKNPVFITLAILPILISGLIAIGIAMYAYFLGEDEK